MGLNSPTIAGKVSFAWANYGTQPLSKMLGFFRVLGFEVENFRPGFMV